MSERAERLRVMLNMGLGHPYLKPRDSLPDLTDEDRRLLDGLTPDDLDLANECLAAEAEFRERAYAHASRLMAFVAAGEGPLEDRIIDLPRPAFREAVRSVIALGWIDG